ncbi:hypothetical protein SAMN04488527_1474 [Aliiroseovarius crassostreae]|uniref:Uncharacterized protein n=1 Tax=Aliiroseovarius crassostreae TaxID=154981 RepID=A0A0P7IGG9_9RHOB|nr:MULTISPECIES: hypothetical protein [Rhodobacterales]KPN62930.1 hypothetical protein AKJ29_01940 [Aliiroseovarius crassostreae]UTS82783.1 hypothetical protein OL67_003893 [Phaeobacter piscinae]SFU94460.1 hypothetical protein SAMN04488527_1474 [Aliiroseovarius crassostreae]
MADDQEREEDAAEAALALGHLGAAHGLPTVLSERFLNPELVRAAVAAKTVLDPDALEVASILAEGRKQCSQQ